MQCIGLADCLRDRGHKIVFTIDGIYEGKVVKYGYFEEKLDEQNEKFDNPGEQFAKILLDSGTLALKSSIEKIEIMSNLTSFDMQSEKIKLNET
jgi:UDP:flavonoid glycosyltransferase YjiC (YdhE family)